MVAVEELAGERPRRKPTWSGQDEHCTFSAGGSSRRRRGFVGQNMEDRLYSCVELLYRSAPRSHLFGCLICSCDEVSTSNMPTAGSVASSDVYGGACGGVHSTGGVGSRKPLSVATQSTGTPGSDIIGEALSVPSLYT